MGQKRHTGPLSPQPPNFDTAAPMSEHVLKSALMYLDDMKGSVSRQNMIDNVAIQYGITSEQAEGVYREWSKVQ